VWRVPQPPPPPPQRMPRPLPPLSLTVALASSGRWTLRRTPLPPLSTTRWMLAMGCPARGSPGCRRCWGRCWWSCTPSPRPLWTSPQGASCLPSPGRGTYPGTPPPTWCLAARPTPCGAPPSMPMRAHRCTARVWTTSGCLPPALCVCARCCVHVCMLARSLTAGSVLPRGFGQGNMHPALHSRAQPPTHSSAACNSIPQAHRVLPNGELQALSTPAAAGGGGAVSGPRVPRPAGVQDAGGAPQRRPV
jgi:hypothetical protein